MPLNARQPRLLCQHAQSQPCSTAFLLITPTIMPGLLSSSTPPRYNRTACCGCKCACHASSSHINSCSCQLCQLQRRTGSSTGPCASRRPARAAATPSRSRSARDQRPPARSTLSSHASQRTGTPRRSLRRCSSSPQADEARCNLSFAPPVDDVIPFGQPALPIT